MVYRKKIVVAYILLSAGPMVGDAYEMRELEDRYMEGSPSPAGGYYLTDPMIGGENAFNYPYSYRINHWPTQSSLVPNNPGYTTQGERDSYYYDSFNANRTGPMSPTYVDTEREAAAEVRSAPYYWPDNAMTNLNREYNTVSDYDFNRTAMTTVTSSGTLTEVQLLSMLSPQGRSLYLNLDPEAKALAIQLASQDSYRNKNLAIKEAKWRMDERRGIMIRGR